MKILNSIGITEGQLEEPKPEDLDRTGSSVEELGVAVGSTEGLVVAAGSTEAAEVDIHLVGAAGKHMGCQQELCCSQPQRCYCYCCCCS